MGYTCESCAKKFAGSHGYFYHIKNDVCNKYKCPKCNKILSNSVTYKNHLENVECDKKLVPKTQLQLQITNDLDQLYPDFKDLTVEKYHQICEENLKFKTQNIHPTQINLNKSKVYIDKRQDNRQINHQYNIIVPPAFLSMDTYENIMKLCPNAMDQAVFKNPTNCIVDLVKSTNCNPDHPEFNSIMITNKRDGSAKVSDGKKFISVSRQKVIADLIDNKRELIQRHINNHPEKYKLISKRLENYLDVLENDDSQKDLENELMYLLMDMKDVINGDQWKADLLAYLELNKTTEIITT